MTETPGGVQRLIDQVVAGDTAARHVLLQFFRDDLKRMVASRLDRRLASRIDPSDVVQDTLADASKRLDDYLRDRPLPILGWLRQLAGDRIIDTHRRHIISQRRSITREDQIARLRDESSQELARRFLANDTSPSNRVSRDERREQVMAALAALSARDREVLVLRYLEQRGAAETAEALGITEGAVKARLLRALIHMRSRLNVTE
jgi:RNA polymerase sigma-70 factor (ECF subfamily)